jgi:eukaryotic-like serine/threonine-protein kinase
VTALAPAARFELVRLLGEGGMGVVYEAIDRERGTRVALKTLRNMTAESLAVLKREFRAMQDLHHPNLVSLGELVSEGDHWFFTMELVNGGEFLDHVRWRPLLAESGPDFRPSEQSMAAAATVTFDPADPLMPLFDDARLRNALGQLAGALCALHAAGLVHRDIKSSNVRVTADGRAVLLDFGLVIGTSSDTGSTQQIAGTPAYMAPEQAASAMVGPEADWYALGALLFEALTRRLPFDGSLIDVMARKQKELPPAPGTLAPGVPDDLNELCTALLNVDPSARPKGQDVLRVLGCASAERSASGTHTQTAAFVGRVAELDTLMAAFRESRRGQPVTVIVEGESGVGKSALVRRFAQMVTLEVPDAVVLGGRCYERESVPYKAFDGVVDALSRLLTRLGKEAARMMPTKPAPLVKVFPVLRRVKAIAESTQGRQPEIEGLDLRTRAFASLRELFTRLADRRPLVVMIDDAHWSDADSLALLADLLRPPQAPTMMLLLTVRADVGPQSTTDQPTRSLTQILKGDLRRIELGPLPEQDATTLASQLLERSGVVDASRARWTAQQAAGHPLFIDMIMRRREALPGRREAALQLEDVLWAIIQELEAVPRAILEVLAVASAPIPQEIARQAASVAAEPFSKAISLLRVAHLVQTTRGEGEDRLVPYHDRMRTAVLGHLDGTRRAECHRRIALALETSPSPDPEALVLHWRGAAEAERAAHYAVLAGEHAAGALAFERAAEFFELALGKRDMAPDDRRALLVKRAKALESAGRGEEAARAYLDAAGGAPPLQRLELERAASVELMACGRLDEGTAALHRVLAAVGMRTPRSRLAAYWWMILSNLWLRIVLRFRPRQTKEVRREDLARLDAIFAAAIGFAIVELVLAWCMSARHLIVALRVGDRFRVLRATALQAACLAGGGGPPSRLERNLNALAAGLVEEEKSPAVRAFFESTQGYTLYQRGQWRDALAKLDSSISIAQSHSHAVGWRTNAGLLGCWTLDLLGEYRELAQRHARYLADAERRGDLYSSVQLRVGSTAGVWLAADLPEEARRNAREAIVKWPSTRYVLQHWQLMVGEAEIELYVGNGLAAYARVERDAPALRESMLLHTQVLRGKTLFLRGRCAIASLDADPALRALRLAETGTLVRKLERERMPWTAPLAAILSAGLASAQGNGRGAAEFLGTAADLADAAGMAGYANAARHQLGLLLGGDEGRDLVEKAREAMAGQGVQAPARFASMLVPGRWLRNQTPTPAADPRSLG